MRLSGLSCYSPGTFDTLDSKRSTAWKQGEEQKQRETEGFHFELHDIHLSWGTTDT